MALGALDKITQGKLRLGLAESFVEGISAMGPLAVSGIGMLVLAPALTKPALKLLSPIYGLFGADPACSPAPSSPATSAAIPWRRP